MGLEKDMRNVTGSVPVELLMNGRLGRGVVVSVQQTAVRTGPDSDPAHVCVFTIEVALDNMPRYNATCRQAVRARFLPELMLPRAIVAVRVDPGDHDRIALSLGEPAPERLVDRGPTPAARILEEGLPCRAVIVRSQPLGLRSPRGHEMYAFVLNVIADGRAPYQSRIGSAVPARALHLVHPGSNVPGRRMPTGAHDEIVIDWDEALARTERAVA